MHKYGYLMGFTMAGPDRFFHYAQARIVDENTVEVICDKVSRPLTVRYAWAESSSTPSMSNKIARFIMANHYRNARLCGSELYHPVRQGTHSKRFFARAPFAYPGSSDGTSVWFRNLAPSFAITRRDGSLSGSAVSITRS